MQQVYSIHTPYNLQAWICSICNIQQNVVSAALSLEREILSLFAIVDSACFALGMALQLLSACCNPMVYMSSLASMSKPPFSCKSCTIESIQPCWESSSHYCFLCDEQSLTHIQLAKPPINCSDDKPCVNTSTEMPPCNRQRIFIRVFTFKLV